VFIKKGI